MRRVRRPAVAGLFYPGGKTDLAGTVDGLLAEGRAQAGPDPRVPKVVIVPHAGYIYSGSTAAQAYARVEPAAERITRVVMFGPSHRVALRGLALPSSSSFNTPLGDVAIGTADISDLPKVLVTDAPHAQEHSLEVQLPFLQRVLGDFELVPFSVGVAEPDEVARVIDRCWGGPETLLVFSTDLSHYYPYDTAQRLDAETVQQMVTMTGPIDPDRACGARPVNGLLETGARRGLTTELYGWCNSGDTAGDKERVVGYAAIGAFEQD
ncbi:AmmeMemoRadiSam system protein B [Granulicoccus sp. GXG6511]|uniref:AmmeMemoRadiSam system protein B n=1 Tax=Granulicoccus sp. GXG6511 TaxID=3381351 RepID=UPI003D7CF0C1